MKENGDEIHVFVKKRFFQLSIRGKLFRKLSFKCCLVVLNIYMHHHTEKGFIFIMFVSMPRSVYVISM